MSNITQKWVELLKPFSNEYSTKMSASELARKTKIPQQTASRILKKLTNLNIVAYEVEGKNKKYYLDIGKKDTKIVLNIIENQKALEFYIKNRTVAVAINDMLEYCESIIIFGSYASGKFNKDSDLDLMIFKGNKDKLTKIINRQIIKINEHYTGYKEFEELLIKRNPLTIEILKNHVLMGDFSRIISIFWRREHGRR
jgi:predicted nucleotidyltransferase